MPTKNNLRCPECNHEICPACKDGCHNIDCSSFARPVKICWDKLNPTETENIKETTQEMRDRQAASFVPSETEGKKINPDEFKDVEYKVNVEVTGIPKDKVPENCDCFECSLKRTTPKQSWEERFDEKFEWTDFSGNVGSNVLVKKDDSYATEETSRNELKSFIKDIRQEAVEEERDRVVGEIEKLIKKHKQRACNIARSSEYDPTNMPSNVENPLVRSLVFSNIDIVRELEDIKNLLTK